MPTITNARINSGTGTVTFISDSTTTATSVSSSVTSTTVSSSITISNSSNLKFINLKDGPGSIVPNALLEGAYSNGSYYINFIAVPDINNQVLTWQNNEYVWSEKKTNINAFITTSPAMSEIISMYISDTSHILPLNCEGSVASVEIAPESLYTFYINQNGSIVASCIISPLGNINFSTESNNINGTIVNKNDILTIVSDNKIDTSIQNFVMNLVLT